MSNPSLTVVDHPLVRHKLSLMRDAEDLRPRNSGGLMREVSLLLAYEVTRDLLPTEEVEITTPLERARLPVLAGKKLCLVSILRARQRHPRRDARAPAVGAGRAYRALLATRARWRRSSIT